MPQSKSQGGPRISALPSPGILDKLNDWYSNFMDTFQQQPINKLLSILPQGQQGIDLLPQDIRQRLVDEGKPVSPNMQMGLNIGGIKPNLRNFQPIHPDLIKWIKEVPGELHDYFKRASEYGINSQHFNDLEEFMSAVDDAHLKVHPETPTFGSIGLTDEQVRKLLVEKGVRRELNPPSDVIDITPPNLEKVNSALPTSLVRKGRK